MGGRQSVRDLAATFLPYCLVIVSEDSAERAAKACRRVNEREEANREEGRGSGSKGRSGRLRGLKSDWSIVLK